MTDFPYGRDYPDYDAWVDEDGTVHNSQLTLDQAHAKFVKWLGNEYDTDALNAVLAAAAVERLDGDPLWLLLISGSGNAKTETVQALDGIEAIVTSTISSQGALLSATAKKERAEDATGGAATQTRTGRGLGDQRRDLDLVNVR